jgi:hypothetical protein
LFPGWQDIGRDVACLGPTSPPDAVVKRKICVLRVSQSLSGHQDGWLFDRHTGLRKHFLRSHRMAANASLRKEIASAVPLAMLKAHRVGIVSAVKLHSEALKGHALRLLRVLLRFADLPDHR